MSVSVDEQPFLLGDWKVEPTLNRISRGEEMVKIDPRNMRVLQLLASKPGRVFSQAEIEQAVWDSVVVTTNSVYQSITQLRKALGDDKDQPKYIETIARKGYRVIADVRPAARENTHERHSGTSLARTSSKHTIRNVVLGLMCIGTLATGIVIGSRVTTSKEVSAVADQRHSTTLPGLPEVANMEPALLRDEAVLALMQGKPNEAYSYLEKAYHLERERVGDGHRDVGYILSNIALTQIWRREYEAAESAARAAINAFKNVPELDPNRIDAVRYLGYALLEGGKYEEAEPQLSIALDLTTRLYGRESRPTAEVLFHLGTLRYSLGQLTEAESIAREIIRIDHAIKSEAFSSSNRNALLVSVLLAQGRFAEAKAEAEATLEKLEHGIRDDHPYLLATRDLLGKSLLGLGRFQEAERIFRRNVELWGKQDGWIEHAVWSMSALGEALIGQGRIAEAEACLARASLQINDRTSGRQEQQRLREHKLRLQKLNLAKAVERPGVKQFSDASTVTR